MRVNLNCPYSEKDQAKRLGARWDHAQRVWYVVGIEDLTPFKRWIPDGQPCEAVKAAPGDARRVTLTRDIIQRHKTAGGAWTRAQLAAIGVDWPPPQGWIDQAIGREIDSNAFLAFSSAAGRSSTKKRNSEPPIVTKAPQIASCGCTHVLPWEDCEHTLATQH